MKVLVTGAGGQVGTELVRVCEEAGDDVIPTTSAVLDTTVRDQVLGAVTSLQPDVVIHTSAYTAVDAAETDVERAFLVNAMGCRHLAEACRLAGTHLVAIGTDYVYDGTKGSAYTEWDLPNPTSVYGLSKLGGEREVLAGCPGAAVVRTSSVQGAHGSNIVKTVLRLAAETDRQLAFVDDQVSNPTFVSDLAPLLRQIAVARVPGVFHATNARPVTWFDFVREVLDAAGFPQERVRPISAAELDRPAPRPGHSALDGLALRGAGFDPLPDFSGPLGRLVKELLDG